MSKFLYEFTVEKEVEKQVSEEKMDGDQKITVTRTEKVKEPQKFAILKPTRKLYDLAEIFLAKTVSDYIKEGIMPITLLAKRFGNDAGVLTTEEQVYINTLKKKVDENQLKLSNLKLDEKADATTDDITAAQEERSKLLLSMMETQAEIDQVRNSYMSLYENTAEMKARKKTIEWWLTQLSYKDKDGKLEEYFPQTSFYERYKAYVDILDGESNFDKKVANKFTFLVQTWFNNSGAPLDHEDLVTADQHFENNFTNE